MQRALRLLILVVVGTCVLIWLASSVLREAQKSRAAQPVSISLAELNLALAGADGNGDEEYSREEFAAAAESLGVGAEELAAWHKSLEDYSPT